MAGTETDLSKEIVLPQDPLFLVGYPRSGSTLLQSLLAALAVSPRILSFPETHYFNVIEKEMHVSSDELIEESAIEWALEKLEEKVALHFAGKERKEMRRLAKDRRLSSKALFERIVSHLLSAQPRFRHADGDVPFRWLEKTPYHANFLDRIISFYPQAQILHILRHPVPAVLSRKLKFPFNKETPLTTLAQHWNHIVENVERFRRKASSRVYTLKYEDLVRNVERELGAVSRFLCVRLDFSRMDRVNSERDAFVLPGEPWKVHDMRKHLVNTNETYRDTISPRDVEAIESVVMETMRRCGYESYGSLETIR